MSRPMSRSARSHRLGSVLRGPDRVTPGLSRSTTEIPVPRPLVPHRENGRYTVVPPRGRYTGVPQLQGIAPLIPHGAMRRAPLLPLPLPAVPDRGLKPGDHNQWDLACKIYIGGLGHSTEKHDVEFACQRFGRIQNLWIARSPPGFAFVEYIDSRDAEDAVQGLHGATIKGRRITVQMSTGKSRIDSKPWYKNDTGHTCYRSRSRSRTRMRSRSRISRCRSRSKSHSRSRQKTRSGSSRYRSRKYHWSSSSSSRSSSSHLRWKGRRYRFGSSNTSTSSSSRKSTPIRLRRRNVNGRHNTSGRRENGTEPHAESDRCSHPANTRSPGNTDVNKDKADMTDNIAPQLHQMGINKRQSKTQGITKSIESQTDVFLLLHFLEMTPEILDESFLRVDRDRVLNSGNLSVVIPTVHKQRVILSGGQVNAKNHKTINKSCSGKDIKQKSRKNHTKGVKVKKLKKSNVKVQQTVDRPVASRKSKSKRHSSGLTSATLGQQIDNITPISSDTISHSKPTSELLKEESVVTGRNNLEFILNDIHKDEDTDVPFRSSPIIKNNELTHNVKNLQTSDGTSVQTGARGDQERKYKMDITIEKREKVNGIDLPRKQVSHKVQDWLTTHLTLKNR